MEKSAGKREAIKNILKLKEKSKGRNTDFLTWMLTATLPAWVEILTLKDVRGWRL